MQLTNEILESVIGESPTARINEQDPDTRQRWADIQRALRWVRNVQMHERDA